MERITPKQRNESILLARGRTANRDSFHTSRRYARLLAMKEPNPITELRDQCKMYDFTPEYTIEGAFDVHEGHQLWRGHLTLWHNGERRFWQFNTAGPEKSKKLVKKVVARKGLAWLNEYITANGMMALTAAPSSGFDSEFVSLFDGEEKLLQEIRMHKFTMRR